MKNHERYATSEDMNSLRTTEELLGFGETLPKYTQDYWRGACRTLEPERINGLADALIAIKDGRNEEATKILKDGWLSDGLVMGSVATYLPEGVGIVRQIYQETWGDNYKNKDFLDQMDKWHNEQQEKLAEGINSTEAEVSGGQDDAKDMKRLEDFFEKKYSSKEYDGFMNPFIEKLDPNRIASFNEQILSNDERSRKWGYIQLMYDISNILELKNRPEIKFLNLSDSRKKELGLDGTGAFYDEDADSVVILDFKDNGHYNKVSSIVNIVAHEMWHKHQYEEIKKGGARASIYRKNFENYIDDQGDIYAYGTQPVEAEAYVFGDKFATAFRRILIKTLQNDIDGYEKLLAKGEYPPDEEHRDIYEMMADDIKKKKDQLIHLRKIKSRFELTPCSQAGYLAAEEDSK